MRERLIVTAWLYGGPAHGDSMDVPTPLPATLGSDRWGDGVYARIGPELDELGRHQTTWCYRWRDDLELDAPRE